MMIAAILGVGAVAAPVSALTGTWTFSALTGVPLSTITVTGSGFSNTNPFDITWQGIATPLVSGTTSSTGTISTSFQVPSVAKGSYTVSITLAGDTAVAKTFAVTESLTLSANTAQVGTSIGVVGRGFTPGVAVGVFFGSFTTAIVTVPATSVGVDGAFSTSFFVPQVPRTSTPYDIYTNASSTTDFAPLAIIPKIISFSAETGGVGDSVVINGDGFTAFGSVSIFFGSESTTALTTVTANSTGIIPATTITIPAAARGTHTIFVRDNTSPAISASRTFTINQTKISLSATSGPVGTSITIAGNGFPASTSISFELDGAAFTGVTSINSGANGSFSKTGVVIPTTTSGQHTIAARYGSDAGAIAEATFTVTSKITLNPTTGTAGVTVTVTGSGFASAATVTLAYDSLPLAVGNVQTSSTGTFTTAFTAPGAAAGAHTVVAADGQGSVASAVFTSTITAEISPVTNTATPGNVGQDMTVSGTGFMPGGTITVKFDNASVATATANATGGFTATFKVPAVAKGDHTVTAADSLTTRTFTFVMEGDAPAAPALSSPATEIKPKQPITFEWNAVTDPSAPVTYKLEVATDANFSTLILSKENLTVTSYTTTEAEKLPTVSKKAPYYWRVIATDGAGNISAPATARTFTVGFSFADVPVWAWIIIGVLLVAIIGGLIYYYSLRRRPPPPMAYT